MNRLNEPGARVLIVDDVSTNLRMIESILAPYGMSIDACTSGEEALKKIAEEDYDLVLMDYIMPGMDGIETVARLRELDTEIPVIALSATSKNDAREMFLRNKFNDYLSKPIKSDELDEALKRWLPLEKLVDRPVCEAESQEQLAKSKLMDALKDLPELDADEAVKRIGSDIGIYERMLSQTTRLLSENIDALGGMTGERYATEAHGIKGALYNIGANKLGSMAAQLERLVREGDLKELSKLHTVFVRQTRELFKKISLLLVDEHEEKLKQKGNVLQLKQAAKELIEAAEYFEYRRPQNILAKLDKYSFGEEMDRIISELNLAFERFDFDAAAELASKLAGVDKKPESLDNKNTYTERGFDTRGED